MKSLHAAHPNIWCSSVSPKARSWCGHTPPRMSMPCAAPAPSAAAQKPASTASPAGDGRCARRAARSGTLPSHDLPKSRRQVDETETPGGQPRRRPAAQHVAGARRPMAIGKPIARGGGDRPRCKRDVVPSMKGNRQGGRRRCRSQLDTAPITRHPPASRPGLPRQPRCGARLEVQPHAGWRHRTRKAVKNTLQQHRRHLPPQHRTGTRPSTMPGASMRTQQAARRPRRGAIGAGARRDSETAR